MTDKGEIEYTDYQATVCIPDGASCYMVNITAGKDGGLAFELVR